MNHNRLHALDAIRGIALLLGLLLHGSMSFWPGLDDFGYPISDNSESMALSYGFYVLHMFRMAVFFLIAGFFAHLSLQRKGTRDFLKDRLKRIALPLLVAYIISLILIVPIALWAASKLYGPDYLNVLQTLPEGAPATPLLMHFWFLYYLLWFYAIAAACSALMHKLDSSGQFMARTTALLFSFCKIRLLLIIAAAISALVFYLRQDWFLWTGIPTPTEAVWNEAPAFVIYGMAFFIGWLCDRQREFLTVIKSHCLQYFVFALILTGYSVTLLPPEPFVLVEVPNGDKLVFAIIYSMASWCWIFAMIGAGMKFFNEESALRRYIADASYWIYIAHIPIIFFLQTVLMDVSWHWSVKFPLIIIITTALLFWMYEKWVRYTFIGTALNGPRQRHIKDQGA